MAEFDLLLSSLIFIHYGLLFFCSSEYNEYNDLTFVNDDNNYLALNNYVGYRHFNSSLMANYANQQTKDSP